LRVRGAIQPQANAFLHPKAYRGRRRFISTKKNENKLVHFRFVPATRPLHHLVQFLHRFLPTLSSLRRSRQNSQRFPRTTGRDRQRKQTRQPIPRTILRTLDTGIPWRLNHASRVIGRHLANGFDAKVTEHSARHMLIAARQEQRRNYAAVVWTQEVVTLSERGAVDVSEVAAQFLAADA